MTQIDRHTAPKTTIDFNRPARASVRAAVGNARFQADSEITPAGLLAIGGMVALILAAVVPIVRAGRP